ncbi:MAG TPA: WD40 repeat domain-containing protein [Polyangiaceae bacterium]|nr:WD40 repeat domain-containing protein [Polyangiaceae bacterium]
MLALAPLASCRAALDLCADGCASAGETSQASVNATDGAGGRDAAGGSPSEAAGNGGAPAICETNDDCADDLICNGDEQCEDNLCVPGTPLTCDAGTSCSEGDPQEPCGFATPSPWLILLGSETIWGLPTAELGKRQLLELGWRKSDGLLVGMNAVTFSANGQHAFVEYLAEDFGQTFLELSFGKGVPKSARPVANLPTWGQYSALEFSPDGRRVLLFDYDLGGYSLDLSGARATVAQLDARIDWGDEVAFCSDNRTWLRVGIRATLYAEASGQPMAVDLEHKDDYDVELSPDGRVIWLGGESQRLVACGPAAQSEALGVHAERAEFSPDSRFLLLTSEEGPAKLLSVTESLTTTEVWSGSGVLDWHWSEGAGSLLLHWGSEDASSYGYVSLSQEQPALVTLALDGAASILSCGREACLARGPAQDDSAGPLVLQALQANAEPVVLGDDSTTAEVVLADFERNRLLLQRTTAQGNELTLSDFAGAPERRLFDWPSGKITVERATDDSGFYIRVKDNVEFSNYWVTIPREANDEATLLPLDVLAYFGTFQPWR